MKASYENIASKKGHESFVAYSFIVPGFQFKWHYHPEYELTLITDGRGKRLVGDSYQNYQAGDLVLLGPDLPHTWISSPRKKRTTASAVVIQFSSDFIQSFSGLKEFKPVMSLLTLASHGLAFPSHELSKDVESLPQKNGIEKVAALLLILEKLAREKSRKLASEYFRALSGKENEERINVVCQYLQRHADEKVELHKVAAQVHLSPSAFCKFFKRATGKTLTDYLNDIRIGDACEQLIESDKPINEIAYRSGFDSLTYFNRVFLRKKKMTPRNFRKHFRHRSH